MQRQQAGRQHKAAAHCRRCPCRTAGVSRDGGRGRMLSTGPQCCWGSKKARRASPGQPSTQERQADPSRPTTASPCSRGTGRQAGIAGRQAAQAGRYAPVAVRLGVFGLGVCAGLGHRHLEAAHSDGSGACRARVTAAAAAAGARSSTQRHTHTNLKQGDRQAGVGCCQLCCTP